MDFKKHLEVAWSLTLEHLAALILTTLVMVVVSITIILAPLVVAGYIRAILLLLKDRREPQISDLFSQTGLFIPLLGFGLLALIVTIIGLNLFILPGLAVIFVITFGCLYMVPLMIESDLNLVEAIRTSWQMALEDNVADHVVVIILFLGFIAIGGSVFIGTLITTPFATVFVLSVFLEKRKQSIAQDENPTPPNEASS